MTTKWDEIEKDSVLRFLREKLAEAEKNVSAREQMAATHEIKMTRADWRAAMALHPSTRGTPMPTDQERAESAARERRIADRYRRDVAHYQATLAFLGYPVESAPQESEPL